MDRPRDWPYLAMSVGLVVAVFAFTVYIAGAPIFHDTDTPGTWTPATVAPPVPYKP